MSRIDPDFFRIVSLSAPLSPLSKIGIAVVPIDCGNCGPDMWVVDEEGESAAEKIAEFQVFEAGSPIPSDH